MFFNRLKRLTCFGGSQESCSQELLAQEPVILNVYDLFSVNKYTSPLGLGVFHSGVQLYGTEYAYGGHRHSFSGIFEIEPCSGQHELGEHFRYRESIHLGYTYFSCDEVFRIVDQLGEQFHGDCYHLTNKNCNHFSKCLVQILCGQNIPGWVNRLAYLVTCVPFLERCLPTNLLTPIHLDSPVI